METGKGMQSSERIPPYSQALKNFERLKIGKLYIEIDPVVNFG